MKFLSVFLVDDERAFNFLTRRLLNRHEMFTEIKDFPDGEDAWNEVIASGPPDLIFLDIRMPGMDGFEFLEEFHRDHAAAETKIFMLTSSVRKEDRAKALSYRRVVDYFEKPLNKEKVEKILSYLN